MSRLARARFVLACVAAVALAAPAAQGESPTAPPEKPRSVAPAGTRKPVKPGAGDRDTYDPEDMGGIWRR